MHTVAETPIFTRRADALLSPQERTELISLLAFNPEVGDVIPGAGGVRKLRFGAGGRGKRGAYRVIYYVLTDAMPVVAIMLYGKNEQSGLTPAQLQLARRLVDGMKAELRQKETRK